MKIGTQLQFPNGFSHIHSHQALYLLNNDSKTEWVTCVEFVTSPKSRRADLHRFQREDFEQGVLDGLIIEAEYQPTLPPWLKAMEGINLQSFELERNGAKRSNLETALLRECIIRPLVVRVNEIFAEPDPARAIAEWVRNNIPEQHATRVRLWLTCYLIFGRQIAALYPSYCQIGHYDRESRPSSTVFGRPPRHRTACRVDAEMISKMERGYVRFGKLSVSERLIYAKTLAAEFGCKVVGKGAGLRIISPDGKPFPSFYQFRYWVRKAYKPDLLRETMYGATRVRNRIAPDQGRFSEGVGNLFEIVEGDGDYLEEQLTDFDGQPLGDGFCTVGLVDVATGGITGIGFAVGSENRSAYQMALFCSAVPKSFFGRLFGLEISDEEWPCRGLPAQIVFDRGPGDGSKGKDGEKLTPFNEITPSFAPRSKAIVESSQPRTMQPEGEPVTYQSAFTPVEVAKREVLRVIRDNWHSDAGTRLTPAMIRDGVAPNPMAMWSWLDRRGRTCAMEISIEDAVRTYLTPVEFTVTRDWIKLGVRRFDSIALLDSGLRSRIPPGQTIRVKGYAMNLCVRYAWIEVDHRLVEVQALLPIRDDDRQLYIGLDYLKKEKDKLNQLQGEQRELNVAVAMKYNSACKEATGKEPDAGSLKKGRKTRNASRKAVARVTKSATMPKEACK